MICEQSSISRRLKMVLDNQSLSITDAAAKCEIPYRSLQNYLRGEREPKVDALISISTRLGISIDWLLTGHGAMYRTSNQIESKDCTQCAQKTQDEMTLREKKLLELFRALPPGEQKNILLDAEKGQRLNELEREVKELQELKASMERLKNAV
ncbi:helix-turn-helix domain-containing protein [Salmonella enterica subsp. enterica serovar Sandiego]|nr:helix-turn-helix domain-containing protein [Salmonella enterica]EBZ3096609.1 helix-turn-helix domain-containing protein [Salmonella enterica subsp. enterica serovar Sandiego]EBZ4654049.1 helix-turn-helix domain-containing protein [Salmonella enterica subsp. enterica serovar Sandiego]EEG6275549.1 helix-turn-helix domain-containing protein [Salmonella enterica subsp. enterica]MFL81093.1 helix-turn-helix domain-containing protein [Salmonella enterica]